MKCECYRIGFGHCVWVEKWWYFKWVWIIDNENRVHVMLLEGEWMGINRKSKKEKVRVKWKSWKIKKDYYE